MSGVERTVRMGSMAYTDPEGKLRRADCGAVVQVHPDAIERFDRLNVLLPVPDSAPAAASEEDQDHTADSDQDKPARARRATRKEG